MIERLVLRFLRWRNGRRHRRCLARIDVLERELFPERFRLRAILPPKQEWLEDLATEPGARWLVEDPKSIQYVESANYHQSIVSAFRRHAGTDGTLRPEHHDDAVATFREGYHELQAKNLAQSAWVARLATEHKRALERASWHPSVVAENVQHLENAERSGLSSPLMMLQRAHAMGMK